MMRAGIVVSEIAAATPFEDGRGGVVIEPAAGEAERRMVAEVKSKFKGASIPPGTNVYVARIGSEWHVIAADCPLR